MRVLAVTPWFPSDVRPGLGLFNLRDVEMLALDHDVTVVHLHDPSLGGSDGEWDHAPNIHVVPVPYHYTRPWTLLPAVRALRRLAANADVIHTMAFPALLPLRFAALPLPWVHTEHWSGLLNDPLTVRAKLAHSVLRRDLKLPDVVVAVGARLASVIAKIRDRPVDVIENFVLLAEPGHLAARWEPLPGASLRLVAAGGLVPWKGPIEAVDTVAALRSSGFDARLKWAGTGSLDEAVARHAADLGIGEWVNLLGYVPPEALGDVLRDSDVFLMPTEYETFGIAFAEALGHGLPVVTTGTGGHVDFLPPQAARIVGERSGAALARAVEELMTDAGRWTPTAIHDYAARRFSADQRRSAYKRMYAQLGYTSDGP